MVEITFEMDTSPIGKLPSKWEKAKKQGLFYNAQDMTRFLQQNSPVDHGRLRGWFIDSFDDEQATIKTHAEYAYWVNYGHRQEVGRFIPGRWVGDKFHYDPNAKNVNKISINTVGGGKLTYGSTGGMVLKQPFVEGKHFVEQSFEQLQPFVVGNFLKALEEQE